MKTKFSFEKSSAKSFIFNDTAVPTSMIILGFELFQLSKRITIIRSNLLNMFLEIIFPKNLSIFTGKHPQFY